jgi:hypothetical protein
MSTHYYMVYVAYPVDGARYSPWEPHIGFYTKKEATAEAREFRGPAVVCKLDNDSQALVDARCAELNAPEKWITP